MPLSLGQLQTLLKLPRDRRVTMARAWVALRVGDHASAHAEAQAGVVAAEPTSLLLVRANAHRRLAEVLRAAGRTGEAASAARDALALDEGKGNLVAAAATRRLLVELR